jgi:2,4-dienoyl-CoA reductase-like NADH-dependent reductase (Old Yellow Enzyme family)
MRLGSDDFNEKGVRFDDAVWAVGALKGHGLDFADLSLGMNTDEVQALPFGEVGFMVDRAHRVRREVGIPVGVSWNLGIPAVADRVVREERVDLVFLGRPALSNPHWPVWAARELGHPDPLSLMPEDWSWWLRNRPGPEGSLGWPPVVVAGRPGDGGVGVAVRS